MGPILMNCCKSEQVSTKEYGKMSKPAREEEGQTLGLLGLDGRQAELRYPDNSDDVKVGITDLQERGGCEYWNRKTRDRYFYSASGLASDERKWLKKKKRS